MRALTVALLAVLVVGVAWAAGEMHVRNCQEAGKVGCSVLPWSGHEQERTLSRIGCFQEREARMLSPYEQTEPLPAECR